MAKRSNARKWTIGGLLAGVAALVALLTWLGINPPWVRPVSSNAISVTSNNQSGGITAGTVNIGPQDRTMPPQLAVDIRQHVPKDRLVTVVWGAGDRESYQYAEQIHAFLKREGFQVKEAIDRVVSVPPPVGVVFDTDAMTITIGIAP